MPKEVKNRVKDFIPPSLVEKIATEDDVKTIDELKVFLKEHNHPIAATWKEETAKVEEASSEEATEGAQLVPTMTATTLPIMAGGFKIILKDAKIYAKKVIIRQLRTEKSENR